MSHDKYWLGMPSQEEWKALKSELATTKADLARAREALADVVSPFRTCGPCQVGVVDHCRCERCVESRLRAALAPEQKDQPNKENL